MKESIFMQMHNGKRVGEGSFNVALKELFYIADNGNRRKLVDAFPEFFGDEVPEFGITNPKNAHTEPSGEISKKKSAILQTSEYASCNDARNLSQSRNDIKRNFRPLHKLLPVRALGN